MFLNKTVFKKWIKEAYNSGILVVGRVFDGLVLAGSHWIVWADEEHVPNWVKAAVIEHVGHLPSEGTMIQYGKGEREDIFPTGLFRIRTISSCSHFRSHCTE